MKLIIDIGNTRAKLFIFGGDHLSAEYFFPKLTVPALKKILFKHRIQASILSSVVKNTSVLSTFLNKNTLFIGLNHATPLPVKNRYKTKETLGNDRIANVVGAAKIFPSLHCLVIDAGTCLKYDFINKRKEYLGGAISPGLMMRYRSLHENTSNLPLVKPGRALLTGTDTKESIISGVQLGMLNEMEGYIHSYSRKYRNLKVVLTGGDADNFAHLFNFPIFAAPKLTAIGLNEILQHHLAKN